MSSHTFEKTPCPDCQDIGWVEQIHPSGTLARVVPCPSSCTQGSLMRYSLPLADTGWYLHGLAQGLGETRTAVPA
jgi:hypothetical protein